MREEHLAFNIRKCEDCECGFVLQISDGERKRVIKSADKAELIGEVIARMTLLIEGKEE